MSRLDSRPIPPLDAAPDQTRGTALPQLVTAVPGPRGQELVDLLAAHECPAITARRSRRAEASGVQQDPIVWERAIGANVWDADGNRFVDLTAGFGVAAAGHSNPLVVARTRDQVERHIHGMGDAFPSSQRVRLAAELAAHLPGDLSQVIFGSNGSDAVEAALKTAVLATGRSGIVAFEGSYHGLSLGALTVSHYKDPFREPFVGLLGPTARWLPFGEDLADLDEAPAAVLVEPIQGRGGDRTAPAAWFQQLRALCDRTGALLIFDEIYTGFGRAGEFVLSGTDAVGGVVPDLLCLGKGLAGGFPMSACVGTERAMAAWGASTGEAIHTSTFLGHPVGCAAARAMLELVDEHGLLERARELGDLMGRTLEDLAARHEGVLGARGRGALRAIELAGGAERTVPLCRALLEHGILLLPAGLRGEVLSFTPPLTLTSLQWELALATIEDLL